jgi:tryptophan halogenase
VQAAIARLLFLFPAEGLDQAVIDKFNALSHAELEQIRDILVLHYTATERDDTPFWRHCRAIEKPDSLRRRIDMYESGGAIYIDPGDVFREPSWFAIFEGQGLRPRAWHPFANALPEAELNRRLSMLSSDVLKRVQTFPSHDEFIRTYCAAPQERMKVAGAGVR